MEGIVLEPTEKVHTLLLISLVSVTTVWSNELSE